MWQKYTTECLRFACHRQQHCFHLRERVDCNYQSKQRKTTPFHINGQGWDAANTLQWYCRSKGTFKVTLMLRRHTRYINLWINILRLSLIIVKYAYNLVKLVREGQVATTQIFVFVLHVWLNHLHPLCYVFKVIQMEEGVLQPCYGAICIQEATHLELVAVSAVIRARSSTHQRQRFFLELMGQHRGGGASARFRLTCNKTSHTYSRMNAWCHDVTSGHSCLWEHSVLRLMQDCFIMVNNIIKGWYQSKWTQADLCKHIPQ